MKLLLTLISVGFLSFGFSQEWFEYRIEGNLLIEAAEWRMVDESIDKDRTLVIFKYTNQGDTPLTLTFKRELEYNDRPKSGSERLYSLQLQPKEERSYFDFPKDKTFYIFKKDHKEMIKSQLIDFSLTDLKLN